MKISRREFWLDAVLGTLFIFLLMGAFNMLFFLKIFDVFDPVGDALGDMEMTDVVFSQLREPPPVEERIVLVNIGRLNRAEIGYMIDIVNQYEPRVIGIDAFFAVPKDSMLDATLEDALGRVPNLVIASKLENFNEASGAFDTLTSSLPRFIQHAETGFANFPTEAKSQDDVKMTREFTPRERVDDKEELAFSVKLAQYLEPEKVDRFLKRGNELETINYRGNVLDYGATKYGTMFYALDVPDVFNGNFEPSVIKDKIVIMCYMGEYLGDRYTIEDKYFSPINDQFAGRTFPDMFGGVVHANIVAMILNEDYIDAMTNSSGIVAAVILCFLNVALFSFIYQNHPKWYDGSTKLIQLIQVLVIMFLGIYVLQEFNYKLELTLATVAIALSGDSLEVFYSVVKNSIARIGIKSKNKIKL